MIEILAGARIGVALYSPRPEHVHAMGNKTFEYMAVGLPVVAPDFPVWREVVRDRRAGLTVDPTDPRKVARAIRYLLLHPREAEAMGASGAEAVASEFNWSSEGERLLRLTTSSTRARSGVPFGLQDRDLVEWPVVLDPGTLSAGARLHRRRGSRRCPRMTARRLCHAISTGLSPSAAATLTTWTATATASAASES